MWKGDPVGPEVTEPLALLVLDHADPAGQHAAIQNATSTLEHLPAQPEPSLGGRRGDRISDGEPTARQVPDTTLDSQLMEGITHLEHLALRVSLDSGPMEGTSCLEPLEQSILQSSWIARPCNGVIKQKSEWKPVITPASSYTLDSRPMEGITYLERPALGVSLDSGPTEGASCPEPLEQSVLDSSLATRPVGCVIENVLDWEPLRNPATSYTLDSRLMEGITNLERTALGVSLDSRPTEGAPCLEPLEQSVLSSSLAERPVEGITKKVSDWKPVINPVIGYTLDSQLMEGITYLECSALGVSMDSRPTEGAPCREPLEQSVLSSSLAARPVEGVAEEVSDRKPVINPVQNIYPYGRPMEGIAYPEHLAPAVSLDSRFSMGMLQAKPLPTLVQQISLVARPQVKFMTSHWKTVINPVMHIYTECLHVRGFP